MTEQELLQLIEDVEQEELHQAPDYLKDMILRKANPPTKQTQLIIYSLKTFATTAAALMILFIIPQTQPNNESIRQEARIQMQTQIQKEKEIYQEKILKNKDRISVTAFLNQGTSYVCNQILTIFEREPNN